jgi:hypothetical protein
VYAKSFAVVMHRTPTRMRIRIAERRGDAGYFAALQRVLLENPDVLKVAARPATGSVVIWCVEGFDLDASDGLFLGLEIVGAPAPLPATVQACRNVAVVDDRIRSMSGGEVGLAAFLVKLVVAIATGGVGLQLLTWCAEALVQAARQRANAPAAWPALTAAAPVPQLAAA